MITLELKSIIFYKKNTNGRVYKPKNVIAAMNNMLKDKGPVYGTYFDDMKKFGKHYDTTGTPKRKALFKINSYRIKRSRILVTVEFLKTKSERKLSIIHRMINFPDNFRISPFGEGSVGKDNKTVSLALLVGFHAIEKENFSYT